MLLQIGLDRLRHFIGRRRAVRRYRYRTDGNDRFDHGVLIQRLVCHGIARRHRRMCVQHSAYVRAFPVAAKVHLDFRGRAKSRSALQHLAFVVDAHQLVRRDEALAHASRGGEERAVLQLDGNISVIRCHPAQLPHLMTDVAKLFFDFLFVHMILLCQICSTSCEVCLYCEPAGTFCESHSLCYKTASGRISRYALHKLP